MSSPGARATPRVPFHGHPGWRSPRTGSSPLKTGPSIRRGHARSLVHPRPHRPHTLAPSARVHARARPSACARRASMDRALARLSPSAHPAPVRSPPLSPIRPAASSVTRTVAMEGGVEWPEDSAGRRRWFKRLDGVQRRTDPDGWRHTRGKRRRRRSCVTDSRQQGLTQFCRSASCA